MLSISLGPIALPVAPLLLLAAVWGASWLASWWVLRSGRADKQELASQAGNAVLLAAGLGLLAARLAHLSLNAEFYTAAPGSAFDVRDGGWHAPTGVAVGAAWLLWRSFRQAPLRRPVAVAVLAAGAFWLTGTLAIGSRGATPLPAVALVDMTSGLPTDLRSAAAGRPVVVNLWASWCGPCRQEMPLLAAAQQRQSSVGLLFVNQGESAAAVRSYLAEMREVDLPLREVLLDAGSQLGPAVGSRGLPTTLFYDAQGRLVDAHFGVLNGPALESRLRTLSATR